LLRIIQEGKKILIRIMMMLFLSVKSEQHTRNRFCFGGKVVVKRDRPMRTPSLLTAATFTSFGEQPANDNDTTSPLAHSLTHQHTTIEQKNI